MTASKVIGPGLIAATLAGAVLAQDEAPRHYVEEIVVTATKREVSVRDIPASITVLKGEDLEQMGAQGIEDFLKLSPGVTLFDDGTNTRRVTIRGISASLGTNATAGVLIGDVPFTDPFLPRVTLDPNPFDMTTLEILKGPQGTLFGGSALNGAIRYVPNPPVFGAWESKVFGQYTAVDQGGAGLIYGAAVNLPISESAAVRAVAHDRQSPGWIDELQRGEIDVNRISQSGGRVLAHWTPGPAWQVSLMAVEQDTMSQDLAFADNTQGRLTRSNTPLPSPVRTRYDLQTLGIGYAFPRFDLLSQSSRIHKRYTAFIDGSRAVGDRPPPTLFGDIVNESTGLIEELRLTSTSDGAWQWLAGLFAYRIELEEIYDILVGDQPLPVGGDVLGPFVPGFEGFVNESGDPSVARFNPDIEVSELALFGEVTRTLWRGLELTLGLRLYDIESGGTVTSSGALVANNTAGSGGTETELQAKVRQSGASPKLAVLAPIHEALDVYANVSRGFRFGGIQLLGDSLTADVPEVFKSDSLWNFETGVRSQWLDGALVADATIFNVEWDQPQLLQSDQGITSYIDNVGGARSSGIELATRYLPPIPGLSLSVSASYIETVTTEAFTTSGGANVPPGTRWPLTPRMQSATTIEYARTFRALKAGLSLVHSYMGPAPPTLGSSTTVFDYHTVDVQLVLSDQQRLWLPELSVSLNNLTDERGLVGARGSPADRNYLRPRTLILRLSSTI